MASASVARTGGGLAPSRKDFFVHRVAYFRASSFITFSRKAACAALLSAGARRGVPAKLFSPTKTSRVSAACRLTPGLHTTETALAAGRGGKAARAAAASQFIPRGALAPPPLRGS